MGLSFIFEVHCGSAFEPGASGLSYDCTPPVCIPALLGALAARRQNKINLKLKKKGPPERRDFFIFGCLSFALLNTFFAFFF